MKRILLTLLVVMTAGMAYVNAQSDSTNSSSNAHAPLQSPGQQPMQYRRQDRVVVKPKDIPPSLKKTLNGNSDYAGWQKSIMYQDKNTKTYYFDLSTGGISKTYYFDENGKTITGPDAVTAPSDNSSGDPNPGK